MELPGFGRREPITQVHRYWCALLRNRRSEGVGIKPLSMQCRLFVAKTSPEWTQLDGVFILLRSAANEQAAAILRGKFVQHFAMPLTLKLPGPGAAQSAAMFLSVMAGFQVMRRIIGMPALVKAKPADLAAQLQALFELLVATKAN
jgi:hypothetical protein